ncbi:MAG: hypothetical protein NVSMB31_20510 [Vulcanimicrobiaceae bacterium]
MQAHVASSSRFGTTYVLLQFSENADPLDLAARYPAAVTYACPIIALAIEPETRKALPNLREALCGPGAPVGAVRAEERGETLLLEFVPAQSSWKLIQRVIETELLRFGSATRTTTLLSPLSLDMEAQIVADCLQCPEILPERVLEALVADAHR